MYFQYMFLVKLIKFLLPKFFFSKLSLMRVFFKGAEDGDINNSADDQVDGVKGQGEDTESSDGKDVIRNKNVSPNLQRILEG